MLLLPNAWDAASAALMEDAGAKAVATSSAAVAWARGYADGESGRSADARAPENSDIALEYSRGWRHGTAKNLGMTPEEMSLPPIGRLDEDSRGLLLLSSDGVVAKAVIGPQSDLDKEYLVRVRGDVTENKLKLLRYGLRLDGRQLKAARVSRMDTFRLKFILREGRNRQIRRMCELVDLEVIDLIRIRIGPLRLDNLPEGRWRMLTAEERTDLLAS